MIFSLKAGDCDFVEGGEGDTDLLGEGVLILLIFFLDLLFSGDGGAVVIIMVLLPVAGVGMG